ncbi:MAG: hypothetical protein LBV00_00130 [Propionibacteriaceae bacterium]|jgi:hypothetical protein|nr:hypothetical protein [Propionibacteriaceae bacterium]
MARILGKPRRHSEGGKAVALTVADMLVMDDPIRALPLDERESTARRAMDAWGFCGVGIAAHETWTGVMIICPHNGLPRQHPLSAGGVDEDVAGLIVTYIASSASPLILGRKLCVSLTRLLRGRVSGIEAQATALTALATPLAPPRSWLTWMGFQPMRYPPHHYRLDFSDTVPWMEKALQWYRQSQVVLSPSGANLSSQSSTDIT